MKLQYQKCKIYQMGLTVVEKLDKTLKTQQQKLSKIKHREIKNPPNEKNIIQLWDNFKQPTLWITGVPSWAGTGQMLKFIKI